MDISKQASADPDHLRDTALREPSPVKGNESNRNEPEPPADAVIHVSTDANELTAFLYIDPPQNGGAAPTLDMMQAALASSGITYNIDTEKLKELETTPVYGSYISVAAGLAPVDGVNGTASFLIRTEKLTAAPKVKEDGSVDFLDLDIVENASKGQVLCQITHPTEGTPGMSVKGRKIKQVKGRPVPSYLGSNTELTEDGTAILSKIDGQVSYAGYQIHVHETFHVRGDIDHSTGNIKVVGNLVVTGGVMPGFTIEAAGDIEVRGIVESSAIKAGGHIRLRSGIIGSNLVCDGDVTCRFIENCNLFVTGDIRAEYIIGSSVKCGKNIKTIGLRARIIGGSLVAGKNIEACVIGSPSGIPTKLEIGTDPAVIKRQQELMAQITELEKSIRSMQPLITMLRQLEAADRLTADKKEIFENVSYSFDTNMELLKDGQRELEEITKSVKTRGFGRIVCTDTIHSGTLAVIGDATLAVKEDLAFASLYYTDGAIHIGQAR